MEQPTMLDRVLKPLCHVGGLATVLVVEVLVELWIQSIDSWRIRLDILALVALLTLVGWLLLRSRRAERHLKTLKDGIAIVEGFSPEIQLEGNNFLVLAAISAENPKRLSADDLKARLKLLKPPVENVEKTLKELEKLGFVAKETDIANLSYTDRYELTESGQTYIGEHQAKREGGNR